MTKFVRTTKAPKVEPLIVAVFNVYFVEVCPLCTVVCLILVANPSVSPCALKRLLSSVTFLPLISAMPPLSKVPNLNFNSSSLFKAFFSPAKSFAQSGLSPNRLLLVERVFQEGLASVL